MAMAIVSSILRPRDRAVMNPNANPSHGKAMPDKNTLLENSVDRLSKIYIQGLRKKATRQTHQVMSLKMYRFAQIPKIKMKRIRNNANGFRIRTRNWDVRGRYLF